MSFWCGHGAQVEEQAAAVELRCKVIEEEMEQKKEESNDKFRAWLSVWRPFVVLARSFFCGWVCPGMELQQIETGMMAKVAELKNLVRESLLL